MPLKPRLWMISGSGATLRPVGGPLGRTVRLGRAMRDGTEPAIVDSRLQLAHARMEAARIGDAEHDPSARHRVERAGGAGAVEGERLLHEDMLPRRRGALGLHAM